MSSPSQFPEGRTESIVEANVTRVRLRLRNLIERTYWHNDVVFVSVFNRVMVTIVGHNPADPDYAAFMKTKGITFDEKGKPIHTQSKK